MRVQMWKVEVRNRSEAKGPRVLQLSYGIWRFNSNNDVTTLHKGSLSSPVTQTEVPIAIQLWNSGSVKNHRPASILTVSLSPSPVACEIVSPYIQLKQVESTRYNVWERIMSLSARPLQSRSWTYTGLLGSRVLDRLSSSFNNIIKLVIDKNISTEHLDILVAKITGFKPSDIRIDYDVNYNKIKIYANESLDLSGVIIEQAIEEFINLLDITNKKEVIDYTVGLYNRSKLWKT